ncbi:DM13 domain-containing protein [Marinicella meishanensis]|uniref:DM13 domain-containing protein n=1 Tax=Marinicella meishanensis TaxID=2873263 RepID=UPI001CBD312B|nr:DM13 domain-containing protein [Marinicella sp. NBU2979]
MKTKTLIILFITHAVVGAVGFAAGIYVLPILIAPEAPSASQVESMAAGAQYTAEFRQDLADSDFLHQGEGTVTVGDTAITFMGHISPGPDYQLYLSPQFVETEAEFKRLKNTMVRVGPVRTFDNFVVPLDGSVDIDQHNTVIIWCESFNEFITAAQYR